MKFQTLTLTASLSAAGAGAVRVQNLNVATQWLIGQLSVLTSPTASGCTCVISPPIGIIDTSYFAGTGDTAQGLYVLNESDYIDCTFSNGPANGTGLVTIIYAEVSV